MGKLIFEPGDITLTVGIYPGHGRCVTGFNSDTIKSPSDVKLMEVDAHRLALHVAAQRDEVLVPLGDAMARADVRSAARRVQEILAVDWDAQDLRKAASALAEAVLSTLRL